MKWHPPANQTSSHKSHFLQPGVHKEQRPWDFIYCFRTNATKTLVSRWRTRVMQSWVYCQYLASSEAVKLLSWSDWDSLIGRWTVSSSSIEMSHSPGGLLTHGSCDAPSSQFMFCYSVNTVSDETVWLSLLLRACEKSRRTLRIAKFLFPW